MFRNSFSSAARGTRGVGGHGGRGQVFEERGNGGRGALIQRSAGLSAIAEKYDDGELNHEISGNTHCKREFRNN